MTPRPSSSGDAPEAIRRLLSFYGDAVSRKDADAAGPLFLPDARVQIADFPERVGREAIVEGFRRTLSRFSFLHQRCDAGMIEADGDGARARVGVMELNRQIGADTLTMIFGTYEDEYRAVNGIWHFARRRFVFRFRAVLAALEMEELAAFEPSFDIAR